MIMQMNANWPLQTFWHVFVEQKGPGVKTFVFKKFDL